MEIGFLAIFSDGFRASTFTMIINQINDWQQVLIYYKTKLANKINSYLRLICIVLFVMYCYISWSVLLVLFFNISSTRYRHSHLFFDDENLVNNSNVEKDFKKFADAPHMWISETSNRKRVALRKRWSSCHTAGGKKCGKQIYFLTISLVVLFPDMKYY